MHAELRVCGERHSRKRIARLMRRAGIAGRVPRRYRRTTIGDPFTDGELSALVCPRCELSSES